MAERVGLREVNAAKRPYINVAAPGIKPLPKSPPYRIQINMENTGANAAQDNRSAAHLFQYIESRRVDAAFDQTQEVHADSHQFGELLLCQSALFADRFNPVSKLFT